MPRGQVLSTLVVMPIDAPEVTRRECTVAGARLLLVDGLIGDAGAIVGRAVRDDGWFDVSTLKEPYRLEGKKTMGLEIFEQLGGRLPDVIIYPAGGGVGLIGIHKAIGELRALGWYDGPSPRLVAVQAEGCAPIVRAYEAGESHATAWEGGKGITFGLNVAKPLGDRLMLAAIAETGGCAIAVADAQLLGGDARGSAAWRAPSSVPRAPATVAAARKLRESGWLAPDDEVILLKTREAGSSTRRRSTPTRRSCRPGNRCPPHDTRVSIWCEVMARAAAAGAAGRPATVPRHRRAARRAPTRSQPGWRTVPAPSDRAGQRTPGAIWTALG